MVADDDERPTSARPWFAYVNLMEAHAPYDPPLRFSPVIQGDNGSGRLGTLMSQFRQVPLRVHPTPGYLRHIGSLYRASTQYQDWLVGRFVDHALSYERPLVLVVVGDHGENLGDHGLFSHHSSLHDTLLHVPLLIWSSDGAFGQARIGDPISTLGLSAWLQACAAGAPSEPPQPDGAVVSEYESTAHHTALPLELRARESIEGALPALVNSPGFAVHAGNLKYVSVDGTADRIYDLAADPMEKTNLLEKDPGLAHRFEAFRSDWLERRAKQPTYSETWDASDITPQSEEEIAEQLRVLGYIE